MGALPPAPFNRFAHATDLARPDDTFVSINNDTVYSIAQLDVSGGPVRLRVPDTDGRYYVLQFVDAWTNNFAYVGHRATGTGAGTYLLVAPGADADARPGETLIRLPDGRRDDRRALGRRRRGRPARGARAAGRAHASGDRARGRTAAGLDAGVPARGARSRGPAGVRAARPARRRVPLRRRRPRAGGRPARGAGRRGGRASRTPSRTAPARRSTAGSSRTTSSMTTSTSSRSARSTSPGGSWATPRSATSSAHWPRVPASGGTTATRPPTP